VVARGPGKLEHAAVPSTTSATPCHHAHAVASNGRGGEGQGVDLIRLRG
jgi:hypothetical protein